ncbi:ribokinase [Pseudomonas sp. RIT-PI-S]|uniref:ribokinase n=1 Tax=Pseudomonas sp. RIT-PI-S TaxID=3035295 RepID=UPI0021D8361D|nr:ribokinase [Pseudomonas sp. RIT-PI-S]
MSVEENTPAQAVVVVVGSLNMDLIVRAADLPRPGQTISGSSFATAAGGKGANQAVAAARLGAQVSMIGCVGDDPNGRALRQALLDDGVDCDGLRVIPDAPTGVALITVDAAGQNTIVIVPGANAALAPGQVDALESALQAAKVVVCQLEVPEHVVGHTLARAKALGKTVILNPAPATGPLPAQWLPWIDYLVPNESEAQLLSGVAVAGREGAEAAAQVLLERGAGKVLLTLGEAGAALAGPEGVQHFPAFQVSAVDATAAGDTFIGAFAAALAQGCAEVEAIRFAQQAAALSVTREGAQPSIPNRQQVLAWPW